MDLVAEFAALHKQLHQAMADGSSGVDKVPVTVTEMAVISEIGADGRVRVKREGQSVSTLFLQVASGVSPLVGDRVTVTKLNGSINTGFISAKV